MPKIREDTMKHADYMKIAMELADRAAACGDVPVGAIVVKNGEIIGKGYNQREACQSATAHAEILAINEACQNLNSWRLNDCTLYVTMEPCPMCSGAIVLARLKTLVFGCSDSIWGGAGSVFNIAEHPGLNHHTEVIVGICESECKAQVQKFFQNRRQINKDL